MTASETKSLPAIGFLTVIENEDHGYIGGYLVLNAAARPLEFHCTAPVMPNQAQTILYGPTLRAYLCGEQIAAALVKHAQAKPLVVLTDMPEVLELRNYVTMPVALAESPSTTGVEQAALDWFALGAGRAAVGRGRETDRERLTTNWPQEAQLDFAEPFERIRSAISEAQRMAA